MHDIMGAIPHLFLGTYTPKLDDKGRLILPSKFRGQFSSGLVMTRGQERCLFLLPMEEFRRMYEHLRQAPVTSRQARDYMRVFLSGASDEMPDKQGGYLFPLHCEHMPGWIARSPSLVRDPGSRSGTQGHGRTTSKKRKKDTRKQLNKYSLTSSFDLLYEVSYRHLTPLPRCQMATVGALVE